jgi:exopolysaccharide biosynthesis polyprenyl glycosylphosphotransferase
MSRATHESHGSVSPHRPVLTGSLLRRDRARPTPRATRRRTAHLLRLVTGDASSAVLAAAIGVMALGAPPIVVAVLPPVWLMALFLAEAYDWNRLSEGSAEFRRVLVAAGLLLSAVALVSWAWRLDVSRGFVALTLPLTAALALAGRWAQRRLVRRARGSGRPAQTTLLIGRGPAVALLHDQLRRSAPGYRVVGCCLPAADAIGRPLGLPVLGGLTDVADVVHRHDVDTVVVLPAEDLGDAVHSLRWQLEPTPAELLLVPAVSDLAAPQMRIRPVGGLPLLHVARPEPRGARRLAKAVIDRAGAALLLLLVAPILVVVAAAVKLDSSGPVLVSQQRVGRNGRLFPMWAFRTTETAAPGPVPAAPVRLTRVGRILRRICLDVLPQLLNVVRGEMSLVGPRPPLPTDVERAGPVPPRLVKPGMTGLSQLSGRPVLSVEESLRLHARYVENWSFLLDLLILWRTCRAVVVGRVPR